MGPTIAPAEEVFNWPFSKSPERSQNRLVTKTGGECTPSSHNHKPCTDIDTDADAAVTPNG